MNAEKKISMVILAGGASSRMGQDKSDLLLDGKTFLEIQIKKGRMLGIEDILISGYHGKKELPKNVRLIRDRFPGKGPLGGLEACLREAKFPQCLVLGIDVPLVPVEELKMLIEKAVEEIRGKEKTSAVILEHHGREEPLMGVYDCKLADKMLEEIIQYKGSVFAFLRRNGYQCVQSQKPQECFMNVNDPEAYCRLKKEICGN